MSHRICHLGAKCPHAHPPASQIPAWNSLDWSVQLQLLRRGGLKTKPKTKSVDAAVAALRREVARKQQEHVEEGQRQAAAAAKAAGHPPNPPAAKAKAGRGRRKAGGPADETEDAAAEASPPKDFTSFAPTDAEAALAEWEDGPDLILISPGLPTNQPPLSEKWTLLLSPERADGLRRSIAPGPWTL